MDFCRDMCCDAGVYFRNVPPKRLWIYAIIASFLLVGIIYIMLPSGQKEEVEPSPAPSESNLLTTEPLIDGYNALPVELMDRLKGEVNSFTFGRNMSSKIWCKSDLPRFRAGLVATQIFTVKPSCSSQNKDAVSKTLQQIDAVKRLMAKYPKDVEKITNFGDILNAKKEGKFGIIIGLDGGHAIDNKLATLRTYYDLGVRCVTLNSECSTAWSLSYSANNTDGEKSLTEFGKEVIREMNRIGMVIDLSRSSKMTQLAVLNVTEAPVILTAVAAHKHSPIEGNVEDEVLEQLKKNNGLAMITFDAKLLSKDTNSSNVTMESVITNINYVRQVVGVNNVGLAAGFHRKNSVPVTDLDDSSKYPLLFERLKTAKNGEPTWTSEDLKKLAGHNFIRVWKSVEEIKNEKVEEVPKESLMNSQDIPKNESLCFSEPFLR